MEKGEHVLREGKSLEETPTWAVATVITVMVSFGFLVHHSLKKFGHWLEKTKRKPLLSALEKIKEELMLFGVLSLLMGHCISFFAKICIKSSAMDSRFYPCLSASDRVKLQQLVVSSSKYSVRLNSTIFRELKEAGHEYCPEGKDSFASHESLEQLHHFVFVLGVIHVSYSFIAIALAMIKIYSWKTWENLAKTMATEYLQESAEAEEVGTKMSRLTTFISNHVSHPWSQRRVLVWLLCFSRQFWSSINQTDYMALRVGFITLILLIGTKLHRVVVKLAVEIMENNLEEGFRKFNPRDELFWLGRPRFLLRLIQFISFQNAFEMASVLWWLWEIKDPSCFMNNKAFLVTRLACSIISQCWCSYITFPLYVIVTQMGSKFKSAVVSENVRDALSKWKRNVKAKHGSSNQLPRESHSTSTLDSMGTDINRAHGQRTPRGKDTVSPSQPLIEQESSSSPKGKELNTPLSFYFKDDCTLNYYDDDDDDDDGDGDDMSTGNNDYDFDAEDEIHRIEP